MGCWINSRPSELALVFVEHGLTPADFADNLPSGAFLLCRAEVAFSHGAEGIKVDISEEWRDDGRASWRSAYSRTETSWPVRSVYDVVRMLSDEERLDFMRSEFPSDRPSRVFAFRPIWARFAINTIFYAAILWLLTLGPFTTRRFIRRKRGRCIKYGYDLRGTTHMIICSECGHEVRAEAGT